MNPIIDSDGNKRWLEDGTAQGIESYLKFLTEIKNIQEFKEKRWSIDHLFSLT